MGDILKDKRFSSIATNPRFKKIPQKDRKVKIDKRFQSMFTDKRFQVKYKVDERGRKINELQSDNYKKYYDLSGTSSESESESSVSEEELKVEKSLNEKGTSSDNVVSDADVANDADATNKGETSVPTEIDVPVPDQSDTISISDKKTKKEKAKEAKREINKYVDEVHKMKLNNKVREKLSDITVDYARGIGTLLSGSDSSSDEESSEESDIETIEHPWGELDKDAETTEEASRRLAVCNMDWDRVNAKDLMVLFHSFLPPEGSLESITIYPSEFGLERMAEEELKGPKELVETKDTFKAASDEEVEEGSLYQREKLREYQLKRLKYYYAVVVCNSKETASTLYSECDGLEYESSATKLDLRFIADDVTFDQKPHDVCTVLPDLKKYKPRLFINTALQQGKVDLTWDETDPNRLDFTRKVLAGEEVDENEINEYLAASSEDEDSDKKNSESESEDESKTEQERILKYRALVSGLQDDKKKRGDVEMEVTWGPDSNRKDDKESSFPVASASEEESAISSDEGDGKTNLNKKRVPVSKAALESNSEDEQKNAELELLLADDNPEESGKHHFNLKAIQKEEKISNKKKKWRKNLKNKKYQEEDTFKIDTKDSRFSALYTSHHFNIDPADPHFRKTKAMNELIAEKQKRRKLESS